MSRCVDLDEKVTAQFYDQECEEWTMRTVTIKDVLDSVCDEYTVLPSAQPKSYREGYQAGFKDAQSEPQWITCSERLPFYAGYYLTTTIYNEVFCDYWNLNEWNRTEQVIAWMPLPKPYKEDDHD